MSETDREKWETRYREGAYQDRIEPSVFLAECLPQILEAQQNSSSLRALDIACGAGRNAIFLARHGYHVDAVDISLEALSRARVSALDAGVGGIEWIEHDLDDGLPIFFDNYDLIVMTRYLDMTLLKSASSRLNDGGFLLSELHLRSNAEVAGPADPGFRAAAGELRVAAHGLSIKVYREGLVNDPDGRTVALARLLARQETARDHSAIP